MQKSSRLSYHYPDTSNSVSADSIQKGAIRNNIRTPRQPVLFGTQNRNADLHITLLYKEHPQDSGFHLRTRHYHCLHRSPDKLAKPPQGLNDKDAWRIEIVAAEAEAVRGRSRHQAQLSAAYQKPI
jgi:hypothetical protein